MNTGDLDHRVRTAAFGFLEEQTQLRGEVLPREILAQGFVFDGQRVSLIGPQGIFKPALLAEMPLSISDFVNPRSCSGRAYRRPICHGDNISITYA